MEIWAWDKQWVNSSTLNKLAPRIFTLFALDPRAKSLCTHLCSVCFQKTIPTHVKIPWPHHLYITSHPFLPSYYTMPLVSNFHRLLLWTTLNMRRKAKKKSKFWKTMVAPIKIPNKINDYYMTCIGDCSGRVGDDVLKFKIGNPRH